MKAVFEKREKNTVHFNIELPAGDFEGALQKAYLKNRGKFNIPGFRKGKVPRKIIEMNFGADIFFEDAINMLLPEAYSDAIEELKLEPVDSPEVDVEEINLGEPVNVKFSVDVKPEVELGDYSTIELEKVDYSATDAMIDAEIDRVRNMNSRMIDAGDRGIANGDFVTMDFEGFIDDEAFEGGASEDHVLEIGSGQFIPGFEEGLLGKKKGEAVEVNVTFPEEYHEESLKGKSAVFKVDIKEVKVKELPELDDEFAKDVSEFDTLEDYKNSIRVELEKQLKDQEKIETENKIVEKVVEMSSFDVPEGMIQSQIDNEIKDFEYRVGMQGFNMERYLELTGMSVEELRDNFRSVAERRVRADLVLEAIAKAEGVEVTEEDLDKELEKLAEQYKQENKEKFVEDMKKGDLGFLKAGISNSKVLNLLNEKVKFI
ncbi:trigger factor [Gudongella oleilytica]|jgi:trigger factor|uniref:trigger factor n=1 Tax=Gudongella oleilytica TaxID=1582259 RepID=UPI000FF88099|nr:trigger factor [Gudongella oleilytica]MDY0256336.1 trigger factor [Gudongella oleilytica]